jgi:hypothetical protein
MFAGAVGAEQADRLAALHADGDVAQDRAAAILLADVIGDQPFDASRIDLRAIDDEGGADRMGRAVHLFLALVAGFHHQFTGAGCVPEFVSLSSSFGLITVKTRLPGAGSNRLTSFCRSSSARAPL